MGGTVSVAQAARELEMSPLTLRWLMANEKIDLGWVKDDKNLSRRAFKIYRKSLDDVKRERGLI